METSYEGHTDKLSLYHSDPTYEAWKLTYGLGIGKESTHSDPTYEAWKHQLVIMGKLF